MQSIALSMPRARIGAFLWVVLALVVGLAACGEDDTSPGGFICGEGTTVRDGQCIAGDAATCGEGTRLEAGRCVAAETARCGNGTRELDGRCIPDTEACGAGTRLVDGRCEPTTSGVACGTGTVEEDGRCVPASGGDDLVCGPGTTAESGQCVPAWPTLCGPGTERQGDVCVPSSSGIVCGPGTELVGSECRAADGTVACGEGTREESGLCVVDEPVTCGPGTERQGGQCVPSADPIACGEGTEQVGDRCLPTGEPVTCGPGTTLEPGTNRCVVDDPVTCGPGTVRDGGACVPSDGAIVCGEGTIEIEGRCEVDSPELRCGPGTVFEAGRCVVEDPVDCGPGTERVLGRCYPEGYPVPEEGDELVWFIGDGSLGYIYQTGPTVEVNERGLLTSVGVLLVRADGEQLDVTPWVDTSFTGAGGFAWSRDGLLVAGEGTGGVRARLGELQTVSLALRSVLTGTGTITLLPSQTDVRLEFELDLQRLDVFARWENGVTRRVTDEVSWTGDTSRATIRRIGGDLFVVGVAGGDTVLTLTWTGPSGTSHEADVRVVATPLLESPALVSPLTGALVVDPASDARIYIPPGALLAEALIEVREIDDGVVQFGPSGLRFVLPTQAEIRLDTPQAPGSPWDLERYDDELERWVSLGAAASVGRDGRTIRFDLQGFSTYRPVTPNTATYRGLCEAHAPALHFAANDSWPMRIEDFAARSRLVTTGPGGTSVERPTLAQILATATGNFTARRLELLPAYRSACAKLSTGSSWVDACRTWEGTTAEPTLYCRVGSVTVPGGRVFDVETRLTVLQYWMLYDASGLPAGTTGAGRLWHEGDWELVQVLLDPRGERVAVTGAQHWYGETRWGAEIPEVDGRPAISVAAFAHANLHHDLRNVTTGERNTGFLNRFRTPATTRPEDIGGTGRLPSASVQVELVTGDVARALNWNGIWGRNNSLTPNSWGRGGVPSPALRQPPESAGPDPWSQPWSFAMAYYHPTEASLVPPRLFLGDKALWFTAADVSMLVTGGQRYARFSLLASRCEPGTDLRSTLWAALPPAQLFDLFRGAASPAATLQSAGDGCEGGEPAGASCLDACPSEGSRRCAADGVQACQRTPAGCLNWGAISACPFGDACTSGFCRPTAASAGAVCDPGTLRCDENANLALTCASDGSRWSARDCGSLTCAGGVCYDLTSGCTAGQTPRTWYIDRDGDGFGDPNTRLLSCNQPPGYVANAADCNDYNPQSYPGATEVCDGRDTNCDGLVDNDCVGGTPAPEGFVLISPGTFLMGSPAGEPGRSSGNIELQHQVTITQAFWMQATEVTQGEWFDVVGNRPSNFGSCGDDCPVERVNWFEAVTYANLLSARDGVAPCYTLSNCTGILGGGTTGTTDGYSCSGVSWTLGCTGYRLPTEAEWEYAYRAGTTTAYYSGPGDALNVNLDRIAWFSSNSGSRTHPVARKEPNAFGLYDMSGNVWEWVWDWSSGTYYASSPANDPRGPGTGSYRVYRGGSWNNDAGNARAATRSGWPPDTRTGYLGFRLARSAP